MMNILICDDDAVLCARLREMLIETAPQDIASIRTFTDGDALFFFLSEEKAWIDMIFMDIRLAGEDSGIDLAQRILKQHPGVQIIFISAYDTYYMDVYRVEHLYFLKKPIEPDRLAAAFFRAKEKIYSEQSKFLYLSTKQNVWKISFRDILYMEKSGRKILFFLKNGEIRQFYGKFSDVLPQLDQRFVRCHNSFLVNLYHVNSLQDRCLLLENGTALPISRSHYDATRDAFSKFLEKSLPRVF